MRRSFLAMVHEQAQFGKPNQRTAAESGAPTEPAFIEAGCASDRFRLGRTNPEGTQGEIHVGLGAAHLA